MNVQYLPISWDTYQMLAQKLAASILQDKNKFDEIVAIARGGLTLGHILSDHLRIPVCSITIQSYTDIQKQGELKITAKLGKHIKGKHILMVDDIADSGKTLKRAKSYLKRFRPVTLTSVTMFYKPQSVVKPDYFAQSTNKWVIFPTEITETIMALQNKHTNKELVTLGFTPNQIAFVQKNY